MTKQIACFLLLAMVLTTVSTLANSTSQVFIVRMKGAAVVTGSGPTPLLSQQSQELRARVLSSHDSLLAKHGIRRQQKLYSYSRTLNAFAAVLSASQVSALAGASNVLSVTPDSIIYKPCTTYAPTFLGLDDAFYQLPPGLWNLANGDDTIVGIIDSGIWPEAPSFNPSSYGSPPKRWAGSCQTGTNWTASNCNNKVIGARYFYSAYESITGVNISSTTDYLSARDLIGHGSHVASLAAGNKVSKASIGGAVFGTAAGTAYRARVAVYKACWTEDTGCAGADILAAFEAAIADNVDVINFSLAAFPPQPLFAPGALADQGALAATRAGIAVAAAAGNFGPGFFSVANQAPWTLTVGASNFDKAFSLGYGNPSFNRGPTTAYNQVTLGNGATYNGSAVTGTTSAFGNKIPLVNAAAAANATAPNATFANLCYANSLTQGLVEGAIVICTLGGNSDWEKSYNLKLLGAKGIIIANSPAQGEVTQLKYLLLPGCHVGASAAAAIQAYASSGSKPTAFISNIIVPTGPSILQAPVVQPFSSRGPNGFLDNMKPDIIAPGFYVLGAWTQSYLGQVETQLPFDQDPRKTKFQIFSGTSAATAFATGTAALLKQIYPKWSPAMVFSAITTTTVLKDNRNSSILDYTGQAATPLQLGSGLLNPSLAAFPGLVYDAGSADFAISLCSSGLDSTYVQTVAGVGCPNTSYSSFDYNSPSLMMSFINGTFSTKRVVTLVGIPGKYTVSINAPPQTKVTITPTELWFSYPYQKQSFRISVQGLTVSDDYVFGSFTWTNGLYKVRSPMIFSVAQV